MEVLGSELWLAETTGRKQPVAIFRGAVMPPDHRPLTVFFGPQLSPGGEYVYFLAEFSATAHALCRLDVSHHRALFLSGDVVQFAVLTTGVNRSRIIASMRTPPANIDDGYSYPFYLLDSHGRTMRRIANESSDLTVLLTRYNSTSRR
jgi:hypothetical protein